MHQYFKKRLNNPPPCSVHARARYISNMLVATFLACAAAAACAASSSPASSAAPAAAPPLAYFKQDRFAISMWVDPQVVPAEYDERYLEIAQANFTVLLGNFGATKISSVTAQLAACEKHGLKAVVSACEGGKTLPPTPRKPGGTCVGIEHPALWGFQLRDEPSAKDFVDVRGGAKTPWMLLSYSV